MTRPFPIVSVVLGVLVLLLVGCQPQQPFYFHEEGDMSHYKGVATEMEYPDVKAESLQEATRASRPFSLSPEALEAEMKITRLSLEEAIHYALANNKVMRSVGATLLQTAGGAVVAPASAPEAILRNGQADTFSTIYGPAIIESDPRGGTEAALAAFDVQFHSLARWDRIREPQNVNTAVSTIFPVEQQGQNGTFQNQLRKTTATGATLAFSHDVLDTESNQPTRLYPRQYVTQLRGELRQPLLQGAGVQFNRIAGPGATPGVNNGVVVARIRTDIALADFEANIRNVLSDVEDAYWNLYLAYRILDANKAGRDFALRNWQEVKARFDAGSASTYEESQVRDTYYQFRQQTERSLVDLYQAEAFLRYMMGLATCDGRLFRPTDEPTTAKIAFDWCECLAEALARNTELRQHRWLVKQRELELIAAKNYLMPRLDLLAMYQFNGLGNDLIDVPGTTGDFTQIGSNSYQSLTGGRYQDWTVGAELTMPLGFRKEMAGVRNAELRIARQRAVLQEAELEVSHQLAFAFRELESSLVITQTNYNRRIAARDAADSAWELYKHGAGRSPALGGGGDLTGSSNRPATLAFALQAEQEVATAAQTYFVTLVAYAKRIVEIHYRKGSLLEYNGVCLAEGPWPAKAYFDALRRARARDASLYIDYGFTRPKVVSQGPVNQQATSGMMLQGEPIEGGVPTEAKPGDARPAEGKPTEAKPPVPPEPIPAPPKELSEPPEGPPMPRAAERSQTIPTVPDRMRTGAWSPRPASAKSYDVGALELRSLGSAADATRTNTAAAGTVVDRSPVTPVSYQEPAVGANRSRQAGDAPSTINFRPAAPAADVIEPIPAVDAAR